MTITTTAPQTSADIDLVTALDAGLLDFQRPAVESLEILSNIAIASGRERGIIAAQMIERLVPAGVQIEEINCGTDAKVRGVFLHQDDDDHIALYFFDRTASVSVHIDSDDPDEAHDGPMPPAEMFDLIRAYYRA
jgi:hypothetical protein